MSKGQFVLQKFGTYTRFWCLIGALSIIFCSNCQPASSNKFNEFPNKILWAWERAENLEFIDTKIFGVAFLAQTLGLTGDEVINFPRRQSLKIPPNTKLIAVTRIETAKQTGKKAELSDRQREEIIRYILKTTELKDVSAIQLDFDATLSERDFYRKLLIDLRQKLPRDFPVSVTALASACIDDNWIRYLPVDEVVPMIFRMGADEKSVKSFLAGGNDFSLPACRTSYGIAVDEPVKANFPGSRRVYFFNVQAWSPKDVEELKLPEIN